MLRFAEEKCFGPGPKTLSFRLIIVAKFPSLTLPLPLLSLSLSLSLFLPLTPGAANFQYIYKSRTELGPTLTQKLSELKNLRLFEPMAFLL